MVYCCLPESRFAAALYEFARLGVVGPEHGVSVVR